MKPSAIIDPEFGALRWNPNLDWWQGTVKLQSDKPFTLYVFSRKSPDRAISSKAREVFRNLRDLEFECRRYAAEQLTRIHNEVWSDGKEISEPEFARRLVSDSVEIHEDGYTELHFGDGGLFWGHGVGVRIRPDGTFQEAVVEG